VTDVIAAPLALADSRLSQSLPARSRQSFRHEAFLWHDIAEFTEAMVTFVEQGLAAGEPVMAALVPEHLDWLRNGLGSRATQVHLVDMRAVGRNPARLNSTWQGFLDEYAAAGQPARGIAEPIWVGRRRDEITECQLHEALLNVAIEADTPFWLLCPYDSKRLHPSVVSEAHRSHHAILDAHTYRGSTRYGGRAYVDSLYRAELPRLSRAHAECIFTADTVDDMFAFVLRDACAADMWSDRALDLAVAARRLAADSLHRGADGGVVRVWDTPRSLICEVSDATFVDDVLAGRRVTSNDDDHGLWSANQLCDLVQVRSTAAGTTVRLHSWT